MDKVLFLILPIILMPSHYAVVCEDNFNDCLVPDSANWELDSTNRNGEAQRYTLDNAYCQDGKLVIEARYKNGEYTSASLRTKNMHDWTYGRFEARLKMPEQGWAAFWLDGYGEWPDRGEIDIQEHSQGKIYSSAFWRGGNSVTCTLIDKFPAGWINDFHVWRLDWTYHNLKWYIDDVLIKSVAITPEMGSAFSQPHYILLSLALGGALGDDPEKLSYPIKYEIDWVRVSQLRK